jgi:ABC-type transport system involved in multi-copper enzyme maturation permease subunit
MRAILTIAHLTWIEARRRRVVLFAILGGLLFLLVFGAAVYAAYRTGGSATNLVQQRIQFQVLLSAGLYVVNFLAIAVAILLPVDTLSGEIESGVMQTLASKPIRRAEILLGKWLTYWLMTGAYLLLMAGGIVLIMWTVSGFTPPGMTRALPLMFLGASVLLTVSMAGGVRLTTITNGMTCFAFYGIAFIGGWIEQIGAIIRNETARYLGTAVSLLSPSDAMWRRAAAELEPASMRELQIITPFSGGSVPTAAMIVWTIGFVVVVLMFAVYQFRRRPL